MDVVKADEFKAHKKRDARALLVVLIVLLVIGVILWILWYRRPSVTEGPSVQEFVLANGSIAYEKLDPAAWQQALKNGLVLTKTNYEESLDDVYIHIGQIELDTDTIGDYVKSITAGNGLSADASGEGSIAVLNIGEGNGIDVSQNGVSIGLASGGGLTFASGNVSLMTNCSANQVLKWTTTWACATVSSSAQNLFQTITGNTGSAVADSTTDTLAITGGDGITTTAASTPDTLTLDIDLASGSGLAFSSGALSLLSCSDGQILKRVSGAWACAADDDNVAPNAAYAQQLEGTDNVTVGTSFTPLLTNGSGTAQNLSFTIASGHEVAAVATVEIASTLATGPVTMVIVRDDNNDNDCVTGGGDGTQVGGQVTSFLASAAQATTVTFSFVDLSPATTSRYQLCALENIATGGATVTDRSLRLDEVSL